ncbi:MAG: hypothetical protein IKH67_04645 [Lachnospiraceae bacterium]|nr:hypothetical protein [Lachnospiraceae bacterium]
MKKITAFIILILTLCLLAGCSGNGGSEETTPEETTPEATTETQPEETVPMMEINPDDIVWDIEMLEEGSDTLFGIYYTNNSPYIVTRIEVRFKPKAEMTPEEQEAFVIYDEEEMEQIFISGYNSHFAASGETTVSVPCEINASGLVVTNPLHFQAMEPASITIFFLGGNGALYKTTKDLTTGEISSEIEREVAHQWYDNELGNLIPEPDGEVLKSAFGFGFFNAIMYGAEREDFDKYKKACAEAGFTVNARETSGFYGAQNADGIILKIFFFENDAELDITVEKE